MFNAGMAGGQSTQRHAPGSQTLPALPLASAARSSRERWNRLCRASRGAPPRGAASA